MPFAKLSRPQIVDEALTLMRAEGLEAVTLRTVAARLDARAPSLYRHIADKEALHALMSERIFRDCLAAVPEGGDWAAWLRGFGHALWAGQSGTPGVLDLIRVRAQDDAVWRELRDEVTRALVSRGLDAATALVAQRSVQALVTGWSTLRRLPAGEGGGDAPLFAALDVLVAGWAARAGGA
ncbi:TetR/AcrR family transcriptional regulator [Sphingomonas baiyangensis]|uniref:TetR family transcriptional regulator n=1 Tax=Sphingomonas baiyangensis TaxID=2572576 RepID=A0A4U1L1I1_9SPHN|nr:TetR family transcriptional regulator [Sphingomonas baiyangensis]TKD50669.1 TetR family transcriptional regulator [Sphingomonas baiyangensis]